MADQYESSAKRKMPKRGKLFTLAIQYMYQYRCCRSNVTLINWHGQDLVLYSTVHTITSIQFGEAEDRSVARNRCSS